MTYITELKKLNKKKTPLFKKQLPKAEIKLIPHGQTDLDKEHLMHGWIDAPLNDRGIEDAKKMAEEIRKYELDGLIPSDMLRARMTAKIISDELGIPILEKNPFFRPWDVGEKSGTDEKELIKILDEAVKSSPDEPIYGGESFNQYKTRFLDGFRDVAERYPGKRIGVVTHHRGEDTLHAWQMDGQPDDYSVDVVDYLNKATGPTEYRELEKILKGDVKPEEPEESLGGHLEGFIKKLVGGIIKEISPLLIPNDGQPGEPGKDADEEKIVKSVLSKIKIPKPKDGKDGKDGKDAVIPKLPEKKYGLADIEGLKEELLAIRSKVSKNYGGHGGITILENVTLTGNTITLPTACRGYLKLYKNGVRQNKGQGDYTLASDGRTITVQPAPQAGDYYDVEFQ